MSGYELLIKQSSEHAQERIKWLVEAVFWRFIAGYGTAMEFIWGFTLAHWIWGRG